jgi:hypothetical protein
MERRILVQREEEKIEKKIKMKRKYIPTEIEARKRRSEVGRNETTKCP